MEKRTFERITVNVQANFFYGKTIYTGMVTNISQKNMYIKIEVCLPFESKFEMLLPFKDGVLKVPVEVSRYVKTGDACHGMGVEVL
ncbi:MAG: PilZ domain-containing protein, partial [Thermodesulfovibrionia bacterium]|nr:PilZ domain-containing protein [Thermodesulfovibrionia bacterium]